MNTLKKIKIDNKNDFKVCLNVKNPGTSYRIEKILLNRNETKELFVHSLKDITLFDNVVVEEIDGEFVNCNGKALKIGKQTPRETVIVEVQQEAKVEEVEVEAVISEETTKETKSQRRSRRKLNKNKLEEKEGK